MTNMRLDQTRISLIAKAPDIGHNLIGRTHIVGIYRQQMEQFAFGGVKRAVFP